VLELVLNSVVGSSAFQEVACEAVWGALNITRQSRMERKIPRSTLIHPKTEIKQKGSIRAAPSEVNPKPPATPPPSQAHLHSAEDACPCQLIQELMTWITVLPLRGSHSFEVKQLFPDGSLGKAHLKEVHNNG